MIRTHLVFYVTMISMALAACTAEEYPSLSYRPVERIGTPVSSVADEAKPDVADPALAAKVQDLMAAARKSHQSFAALAQKTPASPKNSGGDAWASTSIANARLAALHSTTAGALADIDDLALTARLAEVPNELDIAMLSAAQEKIAGLAANERATLAQLSR